MYKKNSGQGSVAGGQLKNCDQWTLAGGQLNGDSSRSSENVPPVDGDGRRTNESADQQPLTADHGPLTTTPLRVLLFDIDGTLIKTVRRGEYRSLIHLMLIDIFGTCGRINEVDFGGRTDLSIYREALECEGITIGQIRERLPRVETAMVDILNNLASSGEVFQLCTGVRELLDALSFDTRFLSSLLTGNVEKLAEAKLRVAGIWHYFKGRGAFGSDDEERDHTLTPDQFVIIGDTPRDIACARHFGARVIGVASGFNTIDQLRKHSPDVLLADLGDTNAVLQALAEM
jgi:phosphoglycolate phosphatase